MRALKMHFVILVALLAILSACGSNTDTAEVETTVNPDDCETLSVMLPTEDALAGQGFYPIPYEEGTFQLVALNFSKECGDTVTFTGSGSFSFLNIDTGSGGDILIGPGFTTVIQTGNVGNLTVDGEVSFQARGRNKEGRLKIIALSTEITKKLGGDAHTIVQVLGLEIGN